MLSAAGLGLAVFGVLRSSVWGWVSPKPDAPELFGLSATLWLILGGLFVVWMFFEWESRLEERGDEPLVRPSMLGTRQLVGGLRIFFFQYFVQSGVFFVVPLFLSVVARALGDRHRGPPPAALGDAADRGRRDPAVPPGRQSAPRGAARSGRDVGRHVVLLAAIDEDASAEIVTLPLLLLGLGIGALASQLGSVTVSAVPDELSPEVGGLQNTATNLGASLGTALAGSVLIASLTATLLAGIERTRPSRRVSATGADVKLASGVPFLSDADLESALDEAACPTNGCGDRRRELDGAAERAEGRARSHRDRRRAGPVLLEWHPDSTTRISRGRRTARPTASRRSRGLRALYGSGVS